MAAGVTGESDECAGAGDQRAIAADPPITEFNWLDRHTGAAGAGLIALLGTSTLGGIEQLLGLSLGHIRGEREEARLIARHKVRSGRELTHP